MTYTTYTLHNAQKTGVEAIAAALRHRGTFERGQGPLQGHAKSLQDEVIQPLMRRVFGVHVTRMMTPALTAGMTIWDILDLANTQEEMLTALADATEVSTFDATYRVQDRRKTGAIKLSPDPGCASIDFYEWGTLYPKDGWWVPWDPSQCEDAP